MKPRFEVYMDKIGFWRFRLVARNGKIVCASEAYISKRNAKQGCETMATVSKNAKIVVID